MRTRERDPLEWAHSALNWAVAEKIVATRSSADERKRRLAQARALAAGALAACESQGADRDAALARTAIAEIDAEIARAPSTTGPK